MTDRKYLEELIHLTARLTDACNNHGFRSVEYNAVLKEIAVSAALFNGRRRRRHWFAISMIFCLLAFLFWLVKSILFGI